jgi:hypothetical protein
MPDPDFGSTYAPATSTATFTNGSTTVTFTNTLLETQAIQGDHLVAGGLIGLVDSVTDDEEIELRYPWTGSTATYQDDEWGLNKISVARYDPASTQAQAREFLSFFRGVGTFYFVSGATPDPGIGINGQFALKINSGPWKIWYKTGGIWVDQGSPAGVDPQGPWNSATTYLMNQWVSWQGSLWSSLQAGNLNHQPDLSPLWWQQQLTAGDRYDVWSDDTDRPGDAEVVLKGYPKGVTFPIGLSDSYAGAEVASTGTAVYSVKKNGVEFATVTFSAGDPVGVIACPVATSFVEGDKLSMTAPTPRDATLSGVAINIVGYR